MASELPDDQGKKPARMLRGHLIGSIVGYLLLAGTLALIFGPRTGSEWFLVTFVIGWGLGGAIGGAIQLRLQRRSTEIGQFLSQQGAGLLFAAPIVLAVWLGQRLYGDIGWWAGFIGGVGLMGLALWLFRLLRNGGSKPTPH